MTPGTPQYGNDSELQADVMRFMAIIAFCLIAILALVRNVTPAEESVPQKASSAPEPARKTPPPQPAEPTLARATALRPEPVVAVAEPTPAPAPAPTPAAAVSTPEPAPAAPEPVREAPPASEPMAAPEPAPAQVPAPATNTPAEDEGLILRFASDGDFLRLIARGDIQVYAFKDRDVLTLDTSYRFLETRSPGQVYELLRTSVPDLVVGALRQARSDADGYRWGISLPGRISRQIDQHLGRVDRGQLVIDRFGDVHHVAAS